MDQSGKVGTFLESFRHELEPSDQVGSNEVNSNRIESPPVRNITLMKTKNSLLSSTLHPAPPFLDPANGVSRKPLLLVLLPMALTLFLPAMLNAADRIALVVGANDYTDAPALKNAVADSQLVAKTLEETGFKVITLENASIKDFHRGLENMKRLSGSAGVGIVYFAGHGVEVDGQNYLLPVDAKLEDPEDLRYQTISLKSVLEDMSASRIIAKVVILDCCRDNPLRGRSWITTRSSKGGLGLGKIYDTDLPESSLILYSAAPGQVALDGTESNSPFTLALTSRLKFPGMSLFDVFHKVSDDVHESTGKRQEPWVKSDGAGRTFRELVLTPETPGNGGLAQTKTADSATPTALTTNEGTATAQGKSAPSPAQTTAAVSSAVASATVDPSPAPATPAESTTPLVASVTSLGIPSPQSSPDIAVGSEAITATALETADTMKAATEPTPGNVAVSPIGGASASTVPNPIEIPPIGYFSNSEVFKGGPYESFNDFSRRTILKEAQGKLGGAGSADGMMGRKTQSAIQAYQQQHSLPATGLLDLATLESLGLTGRTEQSPPVAKSKPKSTRTYSSSGNSGSIYRSASNYGSDSSYSSRNYPPPSNQREKNAAPREDSVGTKMWKSHAYKRIMTGH